MVVGVFEAAFRGAGDWCAEGGEDDDVGGGFGEDLFEASPGPAIAGVGRRVYQCELLNVVDPAWVVEK